jgi:glycosyltransferase involved in cell wall biosynthesis
VRFPQGAFVTARPELSLVVPAYDEATRLPHTLDALLARFPDPTTEIVVVDVGSHDATSAIARAALADRASARVITFPENRGKGAAVRAGVLATTGATVLYMDADLATDLAVLDDFLARLTDADVVVGSRAVPGSRVNDTTRLRAAMGRTFNRMVRMLTRLDVHDSQCGFKAFRGDVARLVFSLSRVDGFAFDPEVLLIAHRLGYRIVEVPVTWTAVDGSSVRPVRDSLRTGVALVGSVVRRRPSKVRADARALGWAG